MVVVEVGVEVVVGVEVGVEVEVVVGVEVGVEVVVVVVVGVEVVVEVEVGVEVVVEVVVKELELIILREERDYEGKSEGFRHGTGKCGTAQSKMYKGYR